VVLATNLSSPRFSQRALAVAKGARLCWFDTIVAIVLLCLQTTASSAEQERIWLDGKINGKLVRLAFDTGASHSALFSKSAERLGLKFKPPNSGARLVDGTVSTGTTEECDFTVWNHSNRMTFLTLELPAYLGRVEGDGIFGWMHIRSNTFLIDAEAFSVELLDRVPEEAPEWMKLAVVERDPTLMLEIPDQLWSIAVDTGSEGGVALVSQKWSEWKAAHTNAPLTLKGKYSPSGGAWVGEEAWAKELSLGALKLTGIPIEQASPIESARGQPILGLAALKRLEFIIDGKQGVAYVRPKRTPPPAYKHNRLGAEFVPRHLQSDDFIAHVVEGSPAQVAGIRNGDILLKFGDRDMRNWRKDPDVLRERLCERPAGTKFEFTLKRGDETLKIPVVLKDILLP
jgi:hypothetical protein